MYVTLDQARALDALATHGTFNAAAKALKKAHTAVLYAVRQLETQTDLVLLDRNAYRSRLTAAGDAVLQHCRGLLDAERRLIDTCATLRLGWEPTLRVVFDAIFPAASILEVVRLLRADGAPTRVHVSTESLDGVEERFHRDEAHVMVTVLPTRAEGLTAVRLPPLSAHLVASAHHPLAKWRGPVPPEELARHVLLTVRGSDPRLQLPTAELDTQSMVQLSDFHAKKAAIVSGIGFGWLPDWLIGAELKRGSLKPLRVPKGASHRFEPRLLHRREPGPAALRLVEALTSAKRRQSE